MQPARGPNITRRRNGSNGSRDAGAGLERYILGIALLVPLALIFMALGQFSGANLVSASVMQTDASAAIMGKRPASSNPEPPPTLVPPTATPRPTETPVPAAADGQATATVGSLAVKGGTYTVQPGDELKQIAAQSNTSIWKIIAANDISNPDSLKVGQVLHIPTE